MKLADKYVGVFQHGTYVQVIMGNSRQVSAYDGKSYFTYRIRDFERELGWAKHTKQLVPRELVNWKA